jgi:hypothetical protein
MPFARKFFGLAVMGKSLIETVFYQRVLSKFAVLIMLAVVTGIMAGILAAGIFYMVYQLLVRNGLEPDVALIVIGVAVAAALAVSAALTAGTIRQMQRVLQPFSPIYSGASDIADAFVSGLLTPSRTIDKYPYEKGNTQ